MGNLEPVTKMNKHIAYELPTVIGHYLQGSTIFGNKFNKKLVATALADAR